MLEVELNAAGVFFRIEAYQKADLKVGDTLELEREPNNPHDPNAVRILRNGTHIGYIPGKESKRFAELLDSRIRVSATVTQTWSKGFKFKLRWE